VWSPETVHIADVVEFRGKDNYCLAVDDVKQTEYSFGEKWRMSADFQSGGLESFDAETLSWILRRNGFSSPEELQTFLDAHQIILDAGCGNGRILGLFADLVAAETRLYGIDLAAGEVARRNIGSKVEQIFDGDLTEPTSLLQIPSPDFIYCQEVLHHTSDPARAFKNLAQILSPGGEIAIYVYKRKAPVREFTDDHVRRLIEDSDYAQAMDLASDFTRLGKVLTELDIEFDVPEVRCLEIPAGRYTVQRFLYHFFAKCYWNPELSTEHNDMINFDWYHPSICSRHTPDEVNGWFESNNLSVVHQYVDEYGITVRGKKPLNL
jgi:SAM-dependent methyltransferase